MHDGSYLSRRKPGDPVLIRLLHGDCVEMLRGMPDCSIDAIVTDPPYGLGFMGKKWDALPPGPEWAAECLRVLKPGGHLIAFGGQRTIHRLVVALEDSGFEIRDLIGWLNWQGFPKSLDASKAIDAAAGAERETAPSTSGAIRWSGWGTALKPCIEPATLARKPLDGTVAETVLKWGTGALNLDACRYRPGDLAWPGPQENEVATHSRSGTNEGTSYQLGATDNNQSAGQQIGRFPSNVYACPKAGRAERERGCEALPGMSGADAVGRVEGSAGLTPRSGAGRTAEHVRNFHPTVKPVQLMRWLVRLVTPPGGVVLDAFLGSGTTGVAAVAEGFDFIGIEQKREYLEIATARISYASTSPVESSVEVPKAAQAGLFG